MKNSAFPLTQLPLQMTTNRSFFRSRALWFGFGIAALLRVMAGLHDIFPVIPALPPDYRLDRHFTERPWNAIGYASMSFNLAGVGLTYFMPLDLAFSTWFFFWLTRAERVIASAVGVTNISVLHLNDRASGAWVGIAVLTLWMSRRHFARFFRHVIGRERGDDSKEPFSYRTVAILTVLSIGLVFGFCYAAGMSLWAIGVFYALFIAFAIAIGRVRAELGPPYHEVIGINPRQMMVSMFGTRRLGGANLTVMTFLYAFNRCKPFAPDAEPDRIATHWRTLRDARQNLALRHGTRYRCRCARNVLDVFTGGISVRRTCTMPRALSDASDGRVSIRFRVGYSIRKNPISVLSLLCRVGSDLCFYSISCGHVCCGGHFTHRGMCISGASWGGLIYFWFPVMVSWLIKFLILRFWGWQMYRKAIPFFLGLVLGDYIPRSHPKPHQLRFVTSTCHPLGQDTRFRIDN